MSQHRDDDDDEVSLMIFSRTNEEKAFFALTELEINWKPSKRVILISRDPPRTETNVASCGRSRLRNTNARSFRTKDANSDCDCGDKSDDCKHLR
jgi:hypothetical protein